MVLATVILTWAHSPYQGTRKKRRFFWRIIFTQACPAELLRGLGGKGKKPPALLPVMFCLRRHEQRCTWPSVPLDFRARSG